MPFPCLEQKWRADDAPTFPILGLPKNVAVWAARIASRRWLAAAHNGELDHLPPEVFTWAVVDAARERYVPCISR